MGRILITGATGMVGKALCSHLTQAGYEINILSRNPSDDTHQIRHYKWNVEKMEIDLLAFDDVETILHLAGANIAEKRWTDQRKEELISSRRDSTQLLRETIDMHQFPVKLIISSSAVGYYGAITKSNILNENSPAGHDFLAEICKTWEKEALKFNDLGIRTVIFRKGIILSEKGGFYQKLHPLAKMGINTTFGTGKQVMPYVSLNDLIEAYQYTIDHPIMQGIYNMVSPEIVTMNELTTALNQSLGKGKFTPRIPALILKMLLGEQSCMLLNGTAVSSAKITSEGFTYHDTNIRAIFDHFKSKDAS